MLVIQPRSPYSLPTIVVDLTGTKLAVHTRKPRQVALHATGVQANLFSRFFRVVRSYANSVGKYQECTDLAILMACILLVKIKVSYVLGCFCSG